MADFRMKQLTETSYLLTDPHDQRLALVVVGEDGSHTMVGGPKPGKYADQRMMGMALGEGTSIEIIQITEGEDDEESGSELGELMGYPVKYREVYDTSEEPVPSYTKKAGSKIRYAAGYYGIGFERGWTQTFCPKLVTLANNEYVGPFATRLEMHAAMSKAKRDARLDAKRKERS